MIYVLETGTFDLLNQFLDGTFLRWDFPGVMEQLLPELDSLYDATNALHNSQ